MLAGQTHQFLRQRRERRAGGRWRGRLSRSRLRRRPLRRRGRGGNRGQGQQSGGRGRGRRRRRRRLGRGSRQPHLGAPGQAPTKQTTRLAAVAAGLNVETDGRASHENNEQSRPEQTFNHGSTSRIRLRTGATPPPGARSPDCADGDRRRPAGHAVGAPVVPLLAPPRWQTVPLAPHPATRPERNRRTALPRWLAYRYEACFSSSQMT